MLVWPTMEKHLAHWLAAAKERFLSWRPLAGESSQTHQIRPADWRTLINRFPRLLAGFAWIALFLGGALVGFGFKTIAKDHLTIGHEDYRLIPSERLYALNAVRERALESGASLPVAARETYPVCEATEEDLAP